MKPTTRRKECNVFGHHFVLRLVVNVTIDFLHVFPVQDSESGTLTGDGLFHRLEGYPRLIRF
ncbi:MAG: hypothetical protein U9R56_01925 [candidate division Zixibacteria bacterium]|nr:hypothetical protein [candidate division Zixibacteria bacterium]